MHIPDGYLGPQTFIPLAVAGGGMLALAIRKVKQTMDISAIPYLAVASAFTFIVQMFNIPIPGGTTGHAVGSGAVAILLGPWTAVVTTSVALIIQALLFGDGGVTALGANIVNMGVVEPFVAVVIFRLITGQSRSKNRRSVGAFIAAYVAVATASVAAGFEFGIQPLIAHGPDGRPLYCPYPLSVALPAMVGQTLLPFGIVEGLVTMALIRALATSLPIYTSSTSSTTSTSSNPPSPP